MCVLDLVTRVHMCTSKSKSNVLLSADTCICIYARVHKPSELG